MAFDSVRLRVKELANALNKTSEDIISVCIILKIQANSPLTSLNLDQCKQITDFYEKESIDHN